ncbi:MAG: phytoene desaturase family protein [Candidatus Binatia bacterium]
MGAGERAYDAVIIGAGPNGLGAAVALARAGCRVIVFEAQPDIGGGARTAQLTLPGFAHDLCSAVHPLAVSSPFFRALPLREHGLEWIHPPAALAHPFDDGTAALLVPSVQATAATLAADAAAYERRIGALLPRWPELLPDLLGPPRWPRHPVSLARFGLTALRSGAGLARSWFTGERARALFSGLAAHSMLPLTAPISAAVGIVLALTAHAGGWPIPRGGAGRISAALASYLRTLGGEIVTGHPIVSLTDLPRARTVICDVTPRQLLAIAGERLPERFRRQLAAYRYGMGAYKIDWALDGPVPWSAGECGRAGTIHLGGTLDEIAASEAAAASGRICRRPFVLAAQPSRFDPERAPPGKHTLWAYCHVPHASLADQTAAVEAQIERFAPGFQRMILARCAHAPADLERRNANLVGGDINGGVQDLRQLVLRPTLRWYGTPVDGLYICSASTPPGGGVHGMCGYNAAMRALGSRLL